MTHAAEDWREAPAPAWEQPALGDHRIEGYRYTSRDFFVREFQGVWANTWLLLGRAADMPDPGDWQREDVGPESVLMVRQSDGSFKAFYNVCQHRGNRLVFADQGRARRFVCRYHGWAYLLDGSLNFAQDAADFPRNPCEHVRLQELRCETFAGFVWVNMNADATSWRSSRPWAPAPGHRCSSPLGGRSASSIGITAWTT